jgi:glycosyltransferase involved in cell wall biosynthesis
MIIEKNYTDGLSICITSFNRKKQLVRLLDSIFAQDLSKVNEVVVLDNSSNYSMNDIEVQFSSKKLRIVRNPFNIGLAVNVVTPFIHCRTKWMWLISDDDIAHKDALSIISQKIKEHSSSSYLKFSIDGASMASESNKVVNSLEQFIDYYHQEVPIRRGALVFMSNGVFNLERLHPFLGRGFEFSYTYIGFLIPVFFSLNNGGSVSFCKEKIITYSAPEDDGWRFDVVGLGMSRLSDLKMYLRLSKRDYKKFLNITMAVKYFALYQNLLKLKTKNPKRVYTSIHNTIYRYYLSPIHRAISFFLLISLTIPKPLRFLYGIAYRRLKK